MDNDVKMYVDCDEFFGPCPVCGGINWKVSAFSVRMNAGDKHMELPIISHAIICADCGVIRINPRLLREMQEDKRQEVKKEDTSTKSDNDSGIIMM